MADEEVQQAITPHTIVGVRIFLQVSSDLQKVLHELDERMCLSSYILYSGLEAMGSLQ